MDSIKITARLIKYHVSREKKSFYISIAVETSTVPYDKTKLNNLFELFKWYTDLLNSKMLLKC